MTTETREPLALTARERVALAWVAAGYTPRDAAAELGISLTTFRGAVASARLQLGMDNPAEAAAAAVALGQIDSDHLKVLPVWPPLPPDADPRDPHVRVTRQLEAAARRAELALLLAQDVPVGIAAERLGITAEPCRLTPAEVLERHRYALRKASQMSSSVHPPAPVPAEHPAAGAGPTPGELTLLERVALTAFAVGPTAEVAARRMGTSARTLRRAQASAVRRLGAVSMVHAVALAASRGWIDQGHLEARTLPLWPGLSPRGAEYLRLRDSGVSAEEATAALGAPRAALRWERAWRARRASSEGGDHDGE